MQDFFMPMYVNGDGVEFNAQCDCYGAGCNACQMCQSCDYCQQCYGCDMACYAS